MKVHLDLPPDVEAWARREVTLGRADSVEDCLIKAARSQCATSELIQMRLDNALLFKAARDASED